VSDLERAVATIREHIDREVRGDQRQIRNGRRPLRKKSRRS
jgi:hypothetical protein